MHFNDHLNPVMSIIIFLFSKDTSNFGVTQKSSKIYCTFAIRV